jgi:hypothetical protein
LHCRVITSRGSDSFNLEYHASVQGCSSVTTGHVDTLGGVKSGSTVPL